MNDQENENFDGSTFDHFLTRFSDRKGPSLSKAKVKQLERITKFLVYFLNTTMKLNARMLGRVFSIDKGTVKAWVKQVDSWSQAEKDATLAELKTGKSLPDKDVLDNEYKVREYKDTDGAGDLYND